MSIDVAEESLNKPVPDRRLEIIEAAAIAFMKEGFASTSVDYIARSLGCTKGLIYYHFKNKTELFFAVHEETIRVNLARMIPIAEAEAPAEVRIENMVKRHIEAIVERLPYQRVSLVGLEMQIIGRTSPEERLVLDRLMVAYRDYENLFSTAVQRGVAEGVFAKGDTDIIVKTLLGAMNWMIMWYRPRPVTDPASDARLRDGMARFVLGGLMRP